MVSMKEKIKGALMFVPLIIFIIAFVYYGTKGWEDPVFFFEVIGKMAVTMVLAISCAALATAGFFKMEGL